MKRALILFAAVVVVAFGAGDVVAAPGDLHEPNTAANGLLGLIQSNASAWHGRLHGFAVRLFWSLAVIQLVMTCFPLVIRGADLAEIVGELIRFILTIGFFAALLMHSADWAQALIDSFRQAGAHAAGLPGTGLNPGDMFSMAVELADTVGRAETWNPVTAVAIAVSSLIVLICFAFLAAFMFVTLVESYIVINASVLFMGFGGSQWTRDYAIAILRYAGAVGAKLFVLTLLVGLIIQSAHQWQAAYNHDDASMLTLVGLSLVCAYLTRTIPDLIQGLIAGVSPGGGTAIGSMAMAVAAAAGSSAAIGAGAAGAAGSAAGATGAASGTESGGLAELINSSLMGGSNRTAAAGVDGSASVATAVESPRIAGAGASVRPVPAAASKSTASDSGTARSETRTEKSSSPSGGIISGHQVAAAAVRTGGVLSAIAVPGMEGAAGLSLGPAGSSLDVRDNNPEPGTDFQPLAPTNTIGPASHSVPSSQTSQPSAARPQKE
jgi:type IV secretion system protein TrbL